MNFNILSKRIRTYTKNEWIAYRNERSQVPWDDILASGFDAVPCDCGKGGCLGWKLVRVPQAAHPSSIIPTPPNSPRAA